MRQNLQLIVDKGRQVPGLDRNAEGASGSTRGQFQYTWRSGLGVTAAGGLVYIAGAGMSIATLTEARAIRGMQLDIRPSWVDLFIYQHDPGGFRAQAAARHEWAERQCEVVLQGSAAGPLLDDDHAFGAVGAEVRGTAP